MVWLKRVRPHTHNGVDQGGAIAAPAATITTLTVAALVAVGSVISLAGGLAVTGAFSAANVTASSMTVSGAGSFGSLGLSTPTLSGYQLRVRAGTGTGGGPTPIILYQWSGSSSTANTVGQMVAASYTLPAGTLVNDGDAIEIYALSRATTTTLAKRIEVRIDGDESSTGASTNGARQWKLSGRMVRTSSTNSEVQFFERERSDPGGAPSLSSDWDTNNSNPWGTDPAVIEILLYGVTGATAPGDEDMTLKFFQVVYWPAS